MTEEKRTIKSRRKPPSALDMHHHVLLYIKQGLEADAIMDRISYDSYKINIESADPSKDISMREIYGLDPEKAR